MPQENPDAPQKQSVTLSLDELRRLIHEESRVVAGQVAREQNRQLLNEIRRVGGLLQSVAEVGLGMAPGKKLPPAPRESRP